MIDSAPSICGSPPPHNACLRQRPQAQWAPEGLWEMLLIDNCLLERQEGGWRGVGGGCDGEVGRLRGEKGEREEGVMCTRGRDGWERWVKGAKRGDGTREEGFGGVSEDGQRLKRNYCYQLLSVFAFIAFSPHISCLCCPTSSSASHQCTPVCSTIMHNWGFYHFKESWVNRKNED